MRTFTTKDITDVDLDQIIITRSMLDGKAVIRVRANATVTLEPGTSTINISINKTVQELGVGPAMTALRNAVLNALREQIA